MTRDSAGDSGGKVETEAAVSSALAAADRRGNVSNADIVRASFDAYLNGDRDAADSLLDPEFRFTSPQDKHIDKPTYMTRCFPTSDRFRTQRLLQVTEADERDVFVIYEYELITGETYRNAEVISVEGGKIIEAHVFFGGRYDEDSDA